MKKTFAIILTLALLLPFGLVPTVSAEGEVTVEPFYVLGWSDFDDEKYPYLDGLLTTSFSNIGDKARLSYGGGTMLYGSYTDEDVTTIATAITKEMNSRPEGARYWTVFGPAKIMKLAPDHAVFLEHGVFQLQAMVTDLVKKLKELNCPLDGVVIDIEYVGMGSWYLYTQSGGHSVDYYLKNPKIYAQIVADPRYQTLIRPLLVEYGFPFWPNPEGNKSEIFSICYTNKGEQYDLARNIWNTVMRIHLNNYSNIWCYQPLKTYYPEASLSDYQSHDSKSWLKLSGITDDGVALSGGNSIKVGDTSSFSYYYARPGASFFEAHKQYASFNDAEYEASAFNGLLYDVNFTRHMYSSSDTKQIAPWITYHTYGGKKAASMAYTPYYTELLYHLGMFDPEPFLSYTYVGDKCFSDGGKDSAFYHTVQKVHNEIMAELTRVAGFSDRKPIEMPQYWNAEYVVSGMYANGRNIWRITPNGDEISLAAFKVKDSDPTFSVKGQTITFPGGKILSETTISEVGSHGYWVETAAGVTPIMTSDPDRYEKYPSFEENFDSYADGKLTAAMMQSSYAWSYNVSAGTCNVAGKALAITGDVTFQNVTVPNKITAGDSYAKQQAWEMTVTVPEGMSKDATLTFLNYTGEAQNTVDGGFQIQGGKVYYSENGEYKELTAIAPGTYKFQRLLNFTDAKSYTCTYKVYDASGKELASAKDVKIPIFSIISSVSFASKQADKAFVLDNYKLYPIGLTTDFELYDGATGINVKGEDAANARDRSTAFRLSWLNGTNTAAKSYVMADIYEGGALKETRAIKILDMNPGCDGVVTGVVDVAAGQSVKVYLSDKPITIPDVPNTTDPTVPSSPDVPGGNGGSNNGNNATEPTDADQPGKDEGNTDNTDNGEKTEKGGMDTAVIVLIIVAVLGIAGVVLAVVLTKKKPEKMDN